MNIMRRAVFFALRIWKKLLTVGSAGSTPKVRFLIF